MEYSEEHYAKARGDIREMKEVIKFLIGKFDYIKTEVLIGVLSAALIGIISRGVNCIRNVWKQNKKIKISQVFSTYAEVEQLPIVTEVKEKNNVGDGTDNIYYKKSFLKAIIENISTRDVPIKKTWIVFDEAKKSEVRDLAVLAHLYKGKFVIYVVNNGFTNITNAKINLEGNIDTDKGKKILSSEQLAKLFCCKVDELYFEITQVDVGEMRRIAMFDINSVALHEQSEGRDWIYICKKVLYDEKLQEKKSFLASVVLNENQIDVIYCQGGGMDVEKYKLKVDVKKCFPQKIELPIEYAILPEKYMQIQVETYVNQSSILKYHFEIEPINGKKVISTSDNVNIAVPIYETDGGFYHKLREWLDRNDIVEYKYNDKPILQIEIEYRW